MKESEYVALLTTKDDFQVVRFFFITKYYKKLQQPSFSDSEVMQHWIHKDGTVTFLQKSTNAQTIYYDCWKFESNLTCKGNIGRDLLRNNTTPYMFFPKVKILPWLCRNGFDGIFHDIVPYKLISSLLSDSLVETLFKAELFHVVRYYLQGDSSKNRIIKHWPSIKICIRHGYNILDVNMWIDYLDLLSHFGKDTHNAFYVCPEDLFFAHDRLVRKRNEEIKKEKEIDRKRKIEENQKLYFQRMQSFLELTFGDSLIKIEPLKSVQEFEKEGEALNHCVFTNEYYLESDSLILSARIDDTPIETIEVSLSQLSVQQCHGRCNRNTKYHNRILDLVNNNMHLIERCVNVAV